MMSKCTICRKPTDLALCDMVTHDERMANPVIPLVGVCGSNECKYKAMDELKLVHAISKGEPVRVVDGTHAGLVGYLYSRNTLGVSFITPEPKDGTLKAVKTKHVVRR